VQSGKVLITDAPVDNNGKGEAFSPTDTVATAMASCMITIMGIKANEMNLDIKGTYAEVTKHMAANPRRISGIDVLVTVKGQLTDRDKTVLENSAKTCPVIQSLHPDIIKNISFNY
tara:strand:- start:257 stop:604 length:348 start_codon:yes stop_codon:yes gene_type:complete